MGDCCSPSCVRFVECGMLGIHAFVKVIPKSPDELPNKDWCGSYEKETKDKDK